MTFNNNNNNSDTMNPVGRGKKRPYLDAAPQGRKHPNTTSSSAKTVIPSAGEEPGNDSPLPTPENRHNSLPHDVLVTIASFLLPNDTKNFEVVFKWKATQNCHRDLPDDVWATTTSFLQPQEMKNLEVVIKWKPTQNCHRDLPNDVWTTIASFLPPHEMKDLEVAFEVPEGSIANQASKSVFQGLRKFAWDYWEAVAAECALRDQSLSILEQHVAKDNSPLATQLHIARESLRVWSECNRQKQLFDDESWHGVYTFVFRLMELVDSEVINVRTWFLGRKDLIATAMWITIGGPSLPVIEEDELVFFYNNPDYASSDNFRYREELQDLISETRMREINRRPWDTIHYNNEVNFDIDVREDEEVLVFALGRTRMSENNVKAEHYLLKNENLRASIGQILARWGGYYTDSEDREVGVFSPIQFDFQDSKCTFCYFYLLALYRYGSTHSVTAHYRQGMEIMNGNSNIAEIYPLVANWLEQDEVQLKHRQIRHYWESDYDSYEMYLSIWDETDRSDDIDFEDFFNDFDFTEYLNNKIVSSSTASSDNIQVQRRCLYVSEPW